MNVWKIEETSGPDYGSKMWWIPGVCHYINDKNIANLISAAPELLEATKALLDAITGEPGSNEVTAIHAAYFAISKAENKD